MPIQRIEDLLALNKTSQTTTATATTPHGKPAPKDDSNPAIKLEERMREIQLEKLEEVCQGTAQDLGLQYINLKGFPIGPEVLSLIPEDQARRSSENFPEKTLCVSCFLKLINRIRTAFMFLYET